MDQFRLDGRVAIVTGSAGGIGQGVALALGERGASVVVCDLREESLATTLDLLKQRNIPCIGVGCDVTKPETFKDVIDKTHAAFGIADILVNNAGITKSQDFFEVEKKDFRDIFEINVIGLFDCTKQFAEQLRGSGKPGSVVNISSNGAKVTYPEQIHYCASKAAVANMTQCMADCLSSYGINANAVCPGAVDTPMLRACMAATERDTNGAITVADCEKTWGPKQLGGRLIAPEEVGRIVAFLCSPAGALIRGQAISVDAGTSRF